MGELALLVKKDLLARGKTKGCAQHWQMWTGRFENICGSKEKYERDDVINYLEWCRGQGFSQPSIDTMLRPLKLLAQIQGWSFPKLSFMKVKDSDIYKPMLSKEEIAHAITKGKKVLVGEELALLAMSTVYGLRCEEMSRTDEPVVDIDAGTIKVHTVKGGETTTHLIPDEIKPYLSKYVQHNKWHTTQLYHQIMCRVGIRCDRGYGWHSIRRALVTELSSSEVNYITVHRFMRWSDSSLKGNLSMLAVYVKKDQARIDTEIFKVHPFLSYWRG